jgi:heterodisulfide reductase subunit B
MSDYIFYPGCSMESSAKAYDESLKAIAGKLDIGLKEIDDWNCCGATEYLSISATPAYSLIARNLALAAQQANGTKTVVASCSACYLNLAKADHVMAEQREFGAKINEALKAGGLSYKAGSLEIRHLVDVLVYDIGLDTLKRKVTRPLTGLRVIPYLGCMVPRPDYPGRFSDHEHPVEFDLLLKTLGAEVIDFPLKTACCGGHMTQISPDTAFEMIRRLISAADQAEADLMVTACPMCQMNLDAFQGEMNGHFHTKYKMPVLFFTQLVGLALGLDAKQLGFGMELVSAREALGKIGVEVPDSDPASASKPVKPRKGPGLPMPTPLPKGPQMPDEEVIE